ESLNPVNVPASTTYAVGTPPDVGAVHCSMTVEPDTDPASPAGTPGACAAGVGTTPVGISGADPLGWLGGVTGAGVTVSTNVSVIVIGNPLTILVAVTVMVAVPLCPEAGLIVSVRVDPLPTASRLAAAFGTSVVLLDVTAIVSALATSNANDSGVFSAVVLFAMSSSDGTASKAPMSTL